MANSNLNAKWLFNPKINTMTKAQLKEFNTYFTAHLLLNDKPVLLPIEDVDFALKWNVMIGFLKRGPNYLFMQLTNGDNINIRVDEAIVKWYMANLASYNKPNQNNNSMDFG